MRVKKKRAIILAESVATVFDDARVHALAEIAKLPRDADLAAFGEAVREAARIFARDARVPTVNELHDEISELWKAADPSKPPRWDRLATLVGNLSLRARELLKERGARPTIKTELPTSDALRDPEQRQAARAAVVKVCQQGGREVEGRLRPSGKRSRPVWQPVLHAPAKARNFPKRDVERDFVMWLSIAWQEATGKPPPRTARHADASRQLGPYARFVGECLRLVGAPDADAVELINELHRRRREMERRAKGGVPK